jgi:hypothetical protein
MKDVVFWDVMPCGSYNNRCFGRTFLLHFQVEQNQRDRNYVSSLFANVVPKSLILFGLMMEAIHSSETSDLTRATRRHIRQDGILHIQQSSAYYFFQH